MKSPLAEVAKLEVKNSQQLYIVQSDTSPEIPLTKLEKALVSKEEVGKRKDELLQITEHVGVSIHKLFNIMESSILSRLRPEFVDIVIEEADFFETFNTIYTRLLTYDIDLSTYPNKTNVYWFVDAIEQVLQFPKRFNSYPKRMKTELSSFLLRYKQINQKKSNAAKKLVEKITRESPNASYLNGKIVLSERDYLECMDFHTVMAKIIQNTQFGLRECVRLQEDIYDNSSNPLDFNHILGLYLYPPSEQVTMDSSKFGSDFSEARGKMLDHINTIFTSNPNTIIAKIHQLPDALRKFVPGYFRDQPYKVVSTFIAYYNEFCTMLFLKDTPDGLVEFNKARERCILYLGHLGIEEQYYEEFGYATIEYIDTLLDIQLAACKSPTESVSVPEIGSETEEKSQEMNLFEQYSATIKLSIADYVPTLDNTSQKEIKEQLSTLKSTQVYAQVAAYVVEQNPELSYIFSDLQEFKNQFGEYLYELLSKHEGIESYEQINPLDIIESQNYAFKYGSDEQLLWIMFEQNLGSIQNNIADIFTELERIKTERPQVDPVKTLVSLIKNNAVSISGTQAEFKQGIALNNNKNTRVSGAFFRLSREYRLGLKYNDETKQIEVLSFKDTSH